MKQPKTVVDFQSSKGVGSLKAHAEGSSMFPDAKDSEEIKAQITCPVCGQKANELKDYQGYDGKKIACPKCKRFNISRTITAISDFTNLSGSQKEKLSKYIAEYFVDFDNPFSLNSENYKTIISLPKDWDFVKEATKKYKENGVETRRYLFDISPQLRYLKLTKKAFASFAELISMVEKDTAVENKRTHPVNVAFMQSIAKQTNPSGPFIDLAVGFGGLIKDLGTLHTIMDINSEVIHVAAVIASQNNTSFHAVCDDAIQRLLPNNGKGVFLFDPPMGMNRTKPKEWKHLSISGDENGPSTTISRSEQILGTYSDDSQSVTEILFLTNFLLRADDTAYFISLVPETFLTRNAREYNHIRKYLIENSLIAVIKPKINEGINTVILVGQKKREKKFNEIKILNIFGNIDNKEIDNIIKNTLDGSIDNNDKYAMSSMRIHDHLLEPYSIAMPNKPLDIKEVRSTKDIIADISSNEALLQTKLTTVLDNSVLKHYAAEETQSVKEEIKWFMKNIEITSILPEAGSGYTHRRENEYDITNISKSCLRMLYEAQSFSYSNDEWVDLNVNFVSFEYIKAMAKLFYCGRLKKEKQAYKVNIAENNTNQPAKYTENKDEVWNLLNPISVNSKIEVLLSIADAFVTDLYLDIAKYYCLDMQEEDTFIKNNDIKDSNIRRSLKILDKLGLVKDQSNNKKLFWYDQHIPFHPFIDGEKL